MMLKLVCLLAFSENQTCTARLFSVFSVLFVASLRCNSVILIIAFNLIIRRAPISTASDSSFARF